MAKKAPKTKPGDKHAGGRPSKYQGAETIRKVCAAAQILRDKPESFLSCCIQAQIADMLDIAESTLYEWVRQYPEFSESLKRWETARNATLPKLAKTLPPAIWIFKAKNMLGWTDKQSVEVGGPDGSPVRVNLEKVITTIDPNGSHSGGD